MKKGSSFGGDKAGMVMVLMPTILQMGHAAMADEEVLGKLHELLRLVSPRISSDDLMEQTMFGVLAIKKYGATIEEAHNLILEVKAITFCFEKFSESGGMDELFCTKNPTH